MKTSLSLAQHSIAKRFDRCSVPVFKRTELQAIFRECRSEWKLAKSLKVDDFIDHMTRRSYLKRHDFAFPSRQETRYTWKKVPLLHTLATLKPGAYFTHHTAARLHGVSGSSLPEIYLNVEQRPHTRNTDSLTQAAIKNAFQNKARVSTNFVQHGRVRIFLINGMNTGELGVVSHAASYDGSHVKVRTTNLERTLIDLAVRPAYAGGVTKVLECFRRAKTSVNVADLAATLTRLNYVYPYHQAIGYYLEKAGYPDLDVAIFAEMPMKFDFYLANKLANEQYVSRWHLYVPG